MKEGLIASSYECPKCNEQVGLNERKSVVLDGFEWRCRKKGVNTHDVCRSIRKNSWFSNSENASQVAEIANGVYGADTVTANYVQFWFRRLGSDLYCQQLDRLKLAIDQKWPELANRRGDVLHQDNVRPHTSVVTCQNLWELGCEVLMHPPYNPDLAPSDYHLFLTLQNFLSGKKLGSREDCENR
ncbi:histone-lysine N-methyltransferase SETMAR [Trichonephila clavipes]|nr:histone-lysine N-methyltransferase SETMAR [Trichonephila clavipes]